MTAPRLAIGKPQCLIIQKTCDRHLQHPLNGKFNTKLILDTPLIIRNAILAYLFALKDLRSLLVVKLGEENLDRQIPYKAVLQKDLPYVDFVFNERLPETTISRLSEKYGDWNEARLSEAVCNPS